jgi:hypothetical protein
MNFVKIGNRCINLANVVQIVEVEYDSRMSIRIDFIGGAHERFYSTEPGYHELQTWISQQPTLRSDQDEQVQEYARRA